jgi:DNA-binding transcriptional regulator YiaG
MTAKVFAAIRRRLGLTQAELAERVGVHRQTVTRWESGALAVPKAMARLMTLEDERRRWYRRAKRRRGS